MLLALAAKNMKQSLICLRETLDSHYYKHKLHSFNIMVDYGIASNFNYNYKQVKSVKMLFGRQPLCLDSQHLAAAAPAVVVVVPKLNRFLLHNQLMQRNCIPPRLRYAAMIQ